jgi:hypothetical protein
MTALSKDHENALKSLEGARVLVIELNKEVSHHKKTIIKVQNESEKWRAKHDELNIAKNILEARIDFYIFIEALKYIVSAIFTGWGIALFSSKPRIGAIMVVGSAVIYIGLTVLEKHLHPKTKKN